MRSILRHLEWLEAVTWRHVVVAWLALIGLVVAVNSCAERVPASSSAFREDCARTGVVYVHLSGTGPAPLYRPDGSLERCVP